LKNEFSRRVRQRFKFSSARHCFRHSTCILAVSVLCCLGQATVVSAQEPSWTHLGPAGAYVKALAIDPVTPKMLYAGMVEDDAHYQWGVYKSIDGGGTWSAANTGLPPNWGVNALVIDSGAPTTLYAGLDAGYIYQYGGGVYKSLDGGGTWSPVNTGLPTNLGTHALAMDPVTPSTLYAGTNGGGVFISIDGGNTWSAGNTGLTDMYVDALAVDPRTTSTLYVGTAYGGVFKSLDSGHTWNAANTGLANLSVLSFAIYPVFTSTLYAGTNVGGVFWRIDGGATGSASVFMSTLYAGTNVGGVFRSIDGGATWSALNTGLPTSFAVHALAVSPVSPSVLYAGLFGGGLFTSADGGNTWSEFDAGMTDPYVHAIVFDTVRGPTSVYAGTCNAGVFVVIPAIGSSHVGGGLTP
jgi:photosystem II stability/assembly factor-like uncharacterized protein